MRSIIAAALVAIAVHGTVYAQAVGRAPDTSQVCLRFSFGTWNPPLDWRAAGHGDFPDTTKMDRAPNGRDWAVADDLAALPDTTVMLFPVWWPAGVLVNLPVRRLTLGDSVSGEAVALKADAARVNPKAPTRAWRISCAGKEL